MDYNCLLIYRVRFLGCFSSRREGCDLTQRNYVTYQVVRMEFITHSSDTVTFNDWVYVLFHLHYIETEINWVDFVLIPQNLFIGSLKQYSTEAN